MRTTQKRNDGSYDKKGEKNPMYGKKAWNKGLTKETDTRIKERGKNLSNRYKSGELVGPNKGKIKTQEEKDKISKTQLANDYQRVCKKTVNYTCLDGSIVKLDSSWEVRLAELLDENSIKWIRPKAIPWIDKKGIKHNYFPDFYLLDYDVFLDPKNDYVIETQKEKLIALSEQYNNIIIMKEKDINIDFILNIK